MIHKIRRRRETSADITIIRKNSIVDIKNDISRILSKRQDSVPMNCPHPDDRDLPDAPPQRLPLQEIRGMRHQDSQRHLLYRSKMESTNVPFPASPSSPEVITPTTLPGSSPTTNMGFLIGETRSLHSSNSKDSAEHQDSKGTGSEDSGRDGLDLTSPQFSPTSRQRIQRQSTTYDESTINQRQGPALSGGRRGSRPFLSPGEASSRVLEGPRGGSRRDSLSPDSAAEEPMRKGSRRDSRQEGSSERESRESSPRSLVKRWGRRWSNGAKEDKTSRSPDSGSSREASPKFGEGHPGIGLRRQSTTDEILIARGFRRESTTEDLMRCRNFRRQSSTADLDISRRSGRRDSSTQINDGQVNSMTVEMSQVGLFESHSQGNVDSMYENSNYHEECLKCNSCGLNLTGPNQRRARRFKNQILCDLHFADMALMESSDFMQQLRNFKAQSLGCAVARRKSSTTLIFPLPPQVGGHGDFTCGLCCAGMFGRVLRVLPTQPDTQPWLLD